MKVRFLKDVTVDVMEPDSGTNDTYDKLMRRGISLECLDIYPISTGFSNLCLEDGDVLVDVKNDCFEKVT